MAEKRHNRLALPPLKEDHQISPSQKQGHWSSEGTGPKFLKILSEALNVNQFAPQDATMFSIPDAWAQPELFAAGLSTEDHPLKARCLEEWRGLISVLGLSKFCGLDISVRPVSLGEMEKKPNAVILTKGPYKNLPSVLRELPPVEVLVSGSNGREALRQEKSPWDSLGFILYGQKAIGMIVPSTLICPARGAININDPKIPWIKGGKIHDPLKVPGLTDLDLKALFFYLKNLNNTLTRQQDRLTDYLALPLIQHIESFMADIAARLGGAYEIDLKDESSALLEMPDGVLFKALKTVPSPLEQADSDLFLRPRSLNGSKDNNISLVLVDKDLAAAIGKLENQIMVWGRISLHEYYQYSNEERKALMQRLWDKGVALKEPKDFFTKRVYHLRGSRLKGHGRTMTSWLYPLKPWVLFLLGPKALRENFSLSHAEDKKRVEVKLAIKVHSPRSNQHEIVDLSKIYRDDEIVEMEHIEKERPSGINAIWPNLHNSGLKHFFYYYNGNPRSQLLLDHPLNPQVMSGILESSNTEQDRLNRVFDLGAMSYQSGQLNEDMAFWSNQTEGMTQTVVWGAHPWEAILCSDKRVARKYSDDPQAGVLLLPELPPAGGGDTGWEIAIDFGTSNTAVYFRPPDREPQAMSFSNRVSGLFGENSRVDWENILTKYFIPPQDQKVPFLSILANRQQNPPSTHPPVLTSLVHFGEDLSTTLDLIQGNDKSIQPLFNLKWDESEEKIRAMERFISQVALQSLTEVVDQGADPKLVTWAFAYPLAMKGRSQDYMHSFEVALEKVLGNGDPIEKRYESLPESVASALYFAKHKEAHFSGNVITIDIGGGTSDLTIWQHQKMLWESSLRLGGRDTLIAVLAHRLDLLNTLGLDEPYDQLREYGPNEPKLINSLEGLVNNPLFSPLFEENLYKYRANKYKNVVDIGMLALAGTLFYLGLMVRHLSKVGLFNPLTKSMDICLGGRGSKLYSLIKKPQSNEPKFLDQARNFFQKASGLNGEVRFIFSREQKHEVACGLLSRKNAASLDYSNPRYEVLCGEDAIAADNELGHMEILKAEYFDDNLRVHPELPQLSGFIAMYEECFGQNVKAYPELKRKLPAYVNDELSEFQSWQKKKQSAEDNSKSMVISERQIRQYSATEGEPVFIIALKKLLKLLIVNSRD